MGGERLAAQPQISQENQVQAVFLYNFAQFAVWPPSAFSSANAPLVIGVLGNDPFDVYLEATIKGEKAGPRPIIIERYQRVEEIKTCHVLFISSSESGKLRKILSVLAGRPILTVGDGEGFAQAGGMVRFFNEKNRVKVRINLGAVEDGGLTISSKMLRAAEIINAKGRGN